MSKSPMLLPCLGFHLVGDRSTVLFSASEKKTIVGGDIGELENKIICPTTHGFMLARDPSSLATFLWSPHSRVKIELPPLGFEIDDDLFIDCTCVLSNKPTTPDCVVLLAQPDGPFIWYCRAGDSQWTKHEYDIGTRLALPEWDLPEEKVVICPIAACHGKFYFNSTSTSLDVIDFCPAPVFSSITIDETIDASYEGGGATVFLVESNDELYMVRLFAAVISEPYTSASVHKMDFSKQQWCPVDDLGDRVFLVSRCEFGASCSGGKAGLQQNCVYFVNRGKRTLEVFNVKDRSIELQKLEDAPLSDKAFWVLPTDI